MRTGNAGALAPIHVHPEGSSSLGPRAGDG
jgi:hypothetical protein